MRAVAKNLIEAQNWAEGIKYCLCKIESWSCNRSHNLEKVDLEHVNNFLNLNPLPCIEPGHLKLKVNCSCSFCSVQSFNLPIEILTAVGSFLNRVMQKRQ